jgi:hypothetical protein
MGTSLQPKQINEDENWSPSGDPDWSKIDLYGNKGKTRNRPNKKEWDPLKPKTNGMTITHQDSTNQFCVMCGGITYEINWDDMWPPLPSVEKPPTGECVWKDVRNIIVGVSNVKYNCYMMQTKCLLQINCVLTYTLKKRDYTCSGDPQYWHQGIAYTQDISKTRASFFTCPCK